MHIFPRWRIQRLAVLFIAASISLAGAVARAQTTQPLAQPNSSGVLSSTPTSLWFHKVTEGQSKVMTAALKNTGGGSVTVSGMSVGSSSSP